MIRRQHKLPKRNLTPNVTANAKRRNVFLLFVFGGAVFQLGNIRKLELNKAPKFDLEFINPWMSPPNVITTNVITNVHSDANTYSNTNTNVRRLPTLDELTSIPANYNCPNGLEAFENLVLPEEITHASRKIPKVVHVTAKSRCVTPQVREHLQQWKFPNHSLYFHDDDAVFKLMDYSVNDQKGHELIRRLSDPFKCISNGATLSDYWRYIILYYYGGIYTDFDNSPGIWYNVTKVEITDQTDSFFFNEHIGVMSQYYLASSRYHPVLLHFLNFARGAIFKIPNVKRNNPAQKTGPKAVKCGMIHFQRANNPNSNSTGYLPPGTYRGGSGPMLESFLPWLGLYENEENFHEYNYPKASDFINRTVTIVGVKQNSKKYIDRGGLRSKGDAYKLMNMTHFHDKGYNSHNPSTNKISCAQHVARVREGMSNETSFYYQKWKTKELKVNYEFRTEEKHYFDKNTNEMIIPWERKDIDDYITGALGKEVEEELFFAKG